MPLTFALHPTAVGLQHSHEMECMQRAFVQEIAETKRELQAQNAKVEGLKAQLQDLGAELGGTV